MRTDIKVVKRMSYMERLAELQAHYLGGYKARKRAEAREKVSKKV